jgi:hypothetical protein
MSTMAVDFSHIDIDREFSTDYLRHLVDNPEWETADNSGSYSSSSSYTQEAQNYPHYPSQEPNYMGSPVSTNYELNAGYQFQAYTNNPSAITPRPQL